MMSALVRQRLRSCPKAETAAAVTTTKTARTLFISALPRDETAQGVRKSRPQNFSAGDDRAADQAVIAHEDQPGEKVLHRRGSFAAQRTSLVGGGPSRRADLHGR